jgi:hypothetical protein
VTLFDRAVLAERVMAVDRHLRRVAHAYATLDMARVHDAATHGPADLRAFLARLAERTPSADT